MNIELSDIDKIIATTLAAAKHGLAPSDAVELKKDLIDAIRAAAEEILTENESIDDDGVVEDIKPPKEKKQFVIMVSDPNKQIKNDITGWVLQLPESASISSVLDRLKTAMYDFNASKAGRLLPVKTIGEGIESARKKYFTARDITIKTKIPVFVVVTDNVLPKE